MTRVNTCRKDVLSRDCNCVGGLCAFQLYKKKENEGKGILRVRKIINIVKCSKKNSIKFERFDKEKMRHD